MGTAQHLLHLGMQLAETLSNMFARHGELGLALDRQRHALVHGQLEQIEAANLECDALCADLERLENHREGLVVKIDRIGRGLNAEPRPGAWPPDEDERGLPVKLDDVLPLLPEAAVTAIATPRQALKAAIPEVQRKLRINTALAQNGSQIVHTTLGIITSVVGRQGPDKHQIYGAKGMTRFGRTQVRSLVNRSA